MRTFVDEAPGDGQAETTATARDDCFPALLFADHVPSAPKWQLSKGGRRVSIPIESITVVDHLDSLFALMRAGLGVTYGPLFLAAPGMVGPPIKRVLPGWEVIHRYQATTGVYALFPGGKKVSAKVRVFVDYLVEEMSAIP